MYYGNAMAKSVAVAATFTSSFLLLPQYAAAHLISDDGLIHKGMQSEDVKTVQTILKATGDYPLRPTGYFGSVTEKSVKQFQVRNGLTADGLVGEQTKQALAALIHKNIGLLAKGSQGEYVKSLQEYLNRFGFYSGSIDGYFGSITEQAVVTLQRNTNIEVDGIVGPQTWGSIEKLDEERYMAESESLPRRQVQQHQVPSVRTVVQGAASAPDAKPVTAVKEFYANSTAYTASCSGCSGITATGINLMNNPNAKVVAVDPSVVPLGTKLYVEGYGYAVAGDTGGAIKGLRIDVFFNSNTEALQWGRRTVKVQVLQ